MDVDTCVQSVLIFLGFHICEFAYHWDLVLILVLIFCAFMLICKHARATKTKSPAGMFPAEAEPTDILLPGFNSHN